MISLDTETTGIDFRHGARPYFVTSSDASGNVKFWEWRVDPLTRQPIVPDGDIEEIRSHIIFADSLVLQNAKFDITALSTLDPDIGASWEWGKTYDTLIAGHLLASNRPHNLTDMAAQYLGWNILPFETKLQGICNHARRIARSDYPEWRIAKDGLEEMPSAKGSVWKMDMWLPKALFEEMGVEKLSERIEEDASCWLTALQEYANADSATTIALITVQLENIKRLGLMDIFKERLKILPVAYKIESRGVSLSSERLSTKQAEYEEESRRAERICVGIAEDMGHELKMPKSGNNKSLTGFCFSELGLNLPVIKRSKDTGAPSLDKEVLDTYGISLPPRSVQASFVRNLAAKRKRDTAINYMDSYRRFWIPVEVDRNGRGWYVLHPSLNPTGTDTLRWSSSNPNEQNISKQKGFNLRYAFGPLPGREWWSFDGKNLELRIPAFEFQEPDLMHVFNHPNDPPYFGSYHLVVFDALHPALFKEHGKKCKDLYESTWYQWVKNGNFAIIYGAQEAKADATYRVQGAYKLIRNRFPAIAAGSDYQVAYADKHGYVETIPDRSLGSKRGYPLLCTRTEYGSVLPTVPLNYHVQGTACWWMDKALVRVQRFFDSLNDGAEFEGKTWPGGYYIVLQVHDELVPDMPSGAGLGENPYDYNMPIANEVARLMALGGDDIGVPTPVGIEYHEHNWSEGVVLF